jgi:hypothetical protein
MFSEGTGDQCTDGINFEPVRPRRELLRDYRSILDRIYAPAAYFARLDAVARRLRPPALQIRMSLGAKIGEFGFLGRLLWYVGTRHPRLFPYFLGSLVRCMRRNGPALKAAVTMMLFYLHLGSFARYVSGEIDRDLARLEEDRAPAPERREAVSA